jgi:hypothetical protein
VGVHQNEPVPYGLNFSLRHRSRVPVTPQAHVGCRGLGAKWHTRSRTPSSDY